MRDRDGNDVDVGALIGPQKKVSIPKGNVNLKIPEVIQDGENIYFITYEIYDKNRLLFGKGNATVAMSPVNYEHTIIAVCDAALESSMHEWNAEKVRIRDATSSAPSSCIIACITKLFDHSEVKSISTQHSDPTTFLRELAKPLEEKQGVSVDPFDMCPF